ncbi:unnamed protein product [Schistosoma margrebowiei]|uniref:Uncharacterized protein n=1 Tax=Schistosoma margrebowiei TaxID=48269 RepID=A0A183LU28_9TREM|nr:unnamed protein product [Schistosoma margrebowiei]
MLDLIQTKSQKHKCNLSPVEKDTVMTTKVCPSKFARSDRTSSSAQLQYYIPRRGIEPDGIEYRDLYPVRPPSVAK